MLSRVSMTTKQTQTIRNQSIGPMFELVLQHKRMLCTYNIHAFSHLTKQIRPAKRTYVVLFPSASAMDATVRVYLSVAANHCAECDFIAWGEHCQDEDITNSQEKCFGSIRPFCQMDRMTIDSANERDMIGLYCWLWLAIRNSICSYMSLWKWSTQKEWKVV